MDPQLDAPPAAHSWLGPPIDARPLFVPEHASLIATLRDIAAPAGTQVRIHVTGPAGGTWTATAGGTWTATASGTSTGTAPDGGNWSLAGPADGHPAALVRLDAETAWRLCVRGIEPADALTRAEIEGDRQLAEAACRIVSVVH
ncbi:hypothetical protein GCM10010321_74480 [Streptomyces chartreusis]|nr:hypothetical protein [Streptomyces chartreusis]GGX46945.1 hypothetical protein GCM10010321_74480 [Streptomyces chartreusis]